MTRIAIGVDPGDREGAVVAIRAGCRVPVSLVAWWTRAPTKSRPAPERVVWGLGPRAAIELVGDPCRVASFVASDIRSRYVLPEFTAAVEGPSPKGKAGPVNLAHVAACGKPAGALEALRISAPLVTPAVWRRHIGIRSQRAGAKAVDARVLAWARETFDLPADIPGPAMRSIPDALGVAWWALHKGEP